MMLLFWCCKTSAYLHWCRYRSQRHIQFPKIALKFWNVLLRWCHMNTEFGALGSKEKKYFCQKKQFYHVDVNVDKFLVSSNKPAQINVLLFPLSTEIWMDFDQASQLASVQWSWQTFKKCNQRKWDSYNEAIILEIYIKPFSTTHLEQKSYYFGNNLPFSYEKQIHQRL